MTEEQDQRPTHIDTLVSEAYRTMADERAPEHLNTAILREAARAARPRYLRLITWTRPLAWAATITLCIALVLEVLDLPAPEQGSFDGDSLKLELPSSEADAGAGIATNDTPDVLREQSAPAGPSLPAPQSAAMKPATRQMPAAPEGRAIAASKQLSLDKTVESTSAAHTCDETARATAESWYACIQALQDAGFTTEAEQESEALLRAFPDFEPR